MHGCSAIMRNFLPHARVLAGSFREHHPDARMTVLVVDGAADCGGEPFDVVGPGDVGLDVEEVNRVLTLFEGALPAGAFRGALMAQLLQAGGEPVVFLDPDTQVFAPMDDVLELAVRHGVVLSPHFLDPPERHQGFAGDRALLLSGAFNSGFFAAGPSGAGFLRWLSRRLQRWTLLAPSEGYYGTQRWLDQVPAMFQHHVLDDPGFNVMTMNAHERKLSRSDGRWLAREQPLRFFHFGGTFDPRRPYLVGAGYAPREALLSEHPCLAELHHRYGEALLANGWDERLPIAPAIELQPGLALDARMRGIYREALLESEEAGTAEPPNPYTHGPAAFVDWLREPTDLRRNACTVTRYLQVCRREDGLAHDFPDLPGDDAARYLAWARGPQGASAAIHPALTDSIVEPSLPVAVRTQGVNVVISDAGLAAFVGRRVLSELRAAGERVAAVPYPRMAGERTRVSSKAAEAAAHDVNVICLDAGSVLDFDYDLGVLFRPWRHVVVVLVDSVWSREALRTAMQVADEVWCWDEGTAEQIRQLCGTHAEVLAFPAEDLPGRKTGGELACFADLAQPGHADALMSSVAAYLDASDALTETLRVYLSGWYVDPLTAETVWGLARSHRCLAVQRADAWHEALANARAIVSLGTGDGPVEAQAMRAGVEVMRLTGGRPRRSEPHLRPGEGRGFGASAVDRLTVLRAGRSAEVAIAGTRTA